MPIRRLIRCLRPFPQQLVEDKRGATAIEYALIALVIAMAIVTALPGIATPINTTFTKIAGKL
jgi:pilus assembly protein Flp/PilA